MPVACAGTGLVDLKISGALPTRADAAPAPPIVPVLALTDDLRSNLFTSPFHPLSENERLVGSVTGEIPPNLFPGCTLIPHHLDASDPLPGPVLAWQALDAVVLDRPPPDGAIQILLAGGTDVVVHSPTAPDQTWPWRRDGPWWILRAPWRFAATPTDHAYDAVAAWQAGLQTSVRVSLLLQGVIVAILILAVRLWKSPKAPYAALAIAMAATAWICTQPRQQQAITAGTVLIGDSARHDWTFFRALQPLHASFPMDTPAVTWPLLPSHGATDLTLLVNQAGQPLQIDYALEDNQTLAFVQSLVIPPQPPPHLTPATPSPLRWILQACYPGAVVSGQPAAPAPAGLGTICITPRQPK